MTFFELGKLGFPLIILFVIYFGTIGYNHQKKVFNFEDKGITNVEGLAEATIGPASANKSPKWHGYVTAITMVAVVIGFVSELWNVGVIALLGASILMLLRIVDFDRVFKNLDWATLVIVGGAQGFAKGLDVSGGGAKIAIFALNLFSDASPMVLLCVLTIVAVVLTNFMSNTAVAAMLVPIGIQVAIGAGADPMTFAMTITTGTSIALTTPIGTAPLTMTLVGGYRWNDYVKVGLPITIISTIAILILAPIVYGL
jgi:sodium-dependent dicarboxylate transporter 2/3/5